MLGVTASPGSTLEGVQEVMRRLHLDRLHVRHRDDAMLIPYAVELAIDDIRLDLPPELLSIVDPIVQLEHSEADRLAREGSSSHPVGSRMLVWRRLVDASQSHPTSGPEGMMPCGG